MVLIAYVALAIVLLCIKLLKVNIILRIVDFVFFIIILYILRENVSYHNFFAIVYQLKIAEQDL